MPTVAYSYEGCPTLKAFASCDAPLRGLMGPFRSGKSSASVAEIIRRGMEQKPGPDGVARTRWLVVRNTYAELQDSTIRTVHMWFPPLQFGEWKVSDKIYTIRNVASLWEGAKGCEIEIWFRALDRPDHVAKLLSVEVTGAWVNEAREVPWTIIEALQGRVGQYPPKNQGGPTWHGVWMDTNPPDTDSKWYRFFEERNHDKSMVRIFKQPSGLSPEAENVFNLPDPRYYQKLAYGKEEEWIKVFIKGEYGFVTDGKPIYSNFSQNLHIRDVNPVPGVTVIRSWDFGLTPACAFSQLLPDGRWLVFDEMVSESMSIDEFSDDVLEHCNRAFRGDVRFEDWGDPAGAARAETDKRSCFDIMIKKGIAIEGSIQNPALRWESVRKPLRTLVGGEPQFVIHPRCRVLIKGFKGAYQLRRLMTSREQYSDKAVKNEVSHIHDALQYGTVQYFAPALIGEDHDEHDLDWDQAESNREYRNSTRSSVTGY